MKMTIRQKMVATAVLGTVVMEYWESHRDIPEPWQTEMKELAEATHAQLVAAGVAPEWWEDEGADPTDEEVAEAMVLLFREILAAG